MAAISLLVLIIPTTFWAARTQWFFLDEWEFLAGRGLHDPGSLLASHNGHWTTLPILLYRLIFQVVGLRSYWPYLVPVVVAHVAVAAQVRLLALRAGAHPWAAVAAMASIAFLGSGRPNFAWGFQVTLTGSLAFGFGQLLVAPTEGPLGRRDAIAIALGCAAAACSALGVVTAGATAVTMALQRGRRAALAHLAGPLGLTGLWALSSWDPAELPPSTASEEARFVLWSFVDSLQATGGSAVAGVALAGLVVLGLLGPDRLPRAWLRGAGANLVALVAAAVAFSVLTASNRAGLYHGRGLTPSRYIYVVAAFVLPVAAVGTTCLMTRTTSAALRVGAIALLLVGLPYNLRRLEPTGSELFTLGSPEQLGALLAVADALGPPSDVEPAPLLMPSVTYRWLADQVAGGLIVPRPRPDDPALAQMRLAVALPPTDVDSGSPPDRTTCAPLQPSQPVSLDVGDVLVVEGASATIGGDGGAQLLLTDAISGRTGRSWQAAVPVQVHLVGSEPASSAVLRCG